MPPAAQLDIVRLVRTVWHVVMGQIRDPHEKRIQARILGLGLVFETRNLVLFLGHQRAQALELGVVASGLGAPDLLGGRIARSQRFLGRGDLRPARSVDRQHVRRDARKPAPRELRVECVRVFADQSDVMHLFALRLPVEGAARLCLIAWAFSSTPVQGDSIPRITEMEMIADPLDGPAPFEIGRRRPQIQAITTTAA